MIHFHRETRVADQVLMLPDPWRCYYPDCTHVITARGAAATTLAIVDHIDWHARCLALPEGQR